MELFLATFNCAKQFQPAESIGSWVQDAISTSGAPPRLLAFGFQELAPIMDGCFEDTKSYTDAIIQGISDALGSDYSIVESVVLGSLGLFVFTHSSLGPIDDTATAFVRRGIIRSALKGGIGIRIKLDADQEFTFVTAHLAANEGMKLARNSDFYQIATSLDFGDGYGLYKPKAHTFFMGDLNYRSIKNPFDENNGSSSPLLTTDVDELSLEVGEDKVLFGFEEPNIEFPPTYKFIKGTKDVYATNRLPSWCDRIFYLTYDNSEVTIHKYSSLPEVVYSDHKPVYLSVKIPKTPPRDAIDSSGSFVRNKSLSLRLQSNAIASYLGPIIDRSIGWGYFLATTRHGRVYLSTMALIILALIRFL